MNACISLPLLRLITKRNQNASMKNVLAHSSRVLLNPLVLIAVALVTSIIGIIIVLDTTTYTKRLNRVERLAPMSATALENNALRGEVLLEGRVSARNAKLHDNFVAYVREEYRDEMLDGDNLQRWVEVKRETPPLFLTLADGDVRLSNNDYIFDTTSVTIEEAAPTITKGAVQVRGFARDSRVMAIGRVTVDGTVNAEFLYAGSRAAYMAEMQRLSSRSLQVGLMFLLVGVVTSILFVRATRQFLREIADERLQAEQTETLKERKQVRTRWQKQ